MTTRWRPFRRSDTLGPRDEGALLILTIIIITTVALVVGAVLTRGSGSLMATVALRNVAGTSYSADSAANVAINGLRTGYGFTAPNKFDNALAATGGSTADKGCFGNTIADLGTDTLSLDGFYPATGTVGQSSAYIECTGETGSGAQGSPVQVSNSNKPGQAILVLGKQSNKGLGFGASAAETDFIHGSVTSDLGLDSKGTLSLTGTGVTVNAVNGCTGTVKVNGVVVNPCGSTGILDPGLAPSHNAAYDPPTTTPALAAAPTCPTSPGGPETYTPGLYTMTPDLAGVTAQVQKITLSGGTSSGTFTPSYGGISGGAQPYNVTPGVLQTALQAAWSTAVTVSQLGLTYMLTFPTILGGPAPNGSLKTLAVTSSLGPGNKSASVTTQTAGDNTCASPNTSGWSYFAPNSALSTGIYYFNWSGSWSVSGTTVGGTISSANDGTTSGGTSISPSGPAPTGAGACVNPIKDTKAVGVELVFGGASQMDFGGSADKEFCASYSLNSIPTVVYGLKTAVGSGPFQVPAQSGCIINSGGNLCAMISGAKKSEFSFEGFTYAPWAYVNINANNTGQPFFNFGMVTDALFLGANPSVKCAQCAFINLPDNSPGYGTASTTLLIKVHVCLGSTTVTASCKTDSPALTARVQLWDINGDNSRRQVSILSWNHLN